MKRSTLDLLRCPDCQAELSLRGEMDGAIVEQGDLFCNRCDRNFPIEDGIPRFIYPQQIGGLDLHLTRFYQRFSRVYPLFTKLAFLPFGGERKARKVVLDRLELNGGRVLEVSIGPGSNLPYLFESPGLGEMYGLDISGAQLARCRRFNERRDWAVELFLGTAERLPFRAETFDTVFHIGGINFFSGKKEAIDEMIRVARPGTKIVIADESERVAQLLYRIPGLSPSHPHEELDTAVPVHLVPDTMEEIRVDGVWKTHGQYHGYCLEFRKPG
jgi:ubiquinone/menaquinone biosynthesis C-methylase UbiE/uncharacterized protein YbaR (Trm112 family)